MNKRTLTIVGIVLTVVSMVSVGAWWYCSWNESILFSESQLDYFMGWGFISHLILGGIVFTWFLFGLSWVVEAIAKRNN